MTGIIQGHLTLPNSLSSSMISIEWLASTKLSQSLKPNKPYNLLILIMMEEQAKQNYSKLLELLFTKKDIISMGSNMFNPTITTIKSWLCLDLKPNINNPTNNNNHKLCINNLKMYIRNKLVISNQSISNQFISNPFISSLYNNLFINNLTINNLKISISSLKTCTRLRTHTIRIHIDFIKMLNE